MLLIRLNYERFGKLAVETCERWPSSSLSADSTIVIAAVIATEYPCVISICSSTRVYAQIDSNSLMQVSFERTRLNKFIFLGRGWRHRSSVGDESIFQLLFCHRRHPSHFSVLLQQSQQLIHKTSILFQLICNSPTLHSEAPC